MKKRNISDFTMDDIVAVNRHSSVFFITWCIDTACNYDCSYCSSALHNYADTNQKSLNDMKTIWRNIYDEIKDKFTKVDIVFTGGEVTINKNFLPFIKWLHENYSIINHMLLTSNGSATSAYYIKALKYLTHLTLSTHLEWMNEKKFFETVLDCHKIFLQQGHPYRFKVQVMGEEYNDEFIAKLDSYEQFLKEHDISHSRKRLQFASQTHLDEFNVFSTHNLKSQSSSNQFDFEKHKNG